MCVLLGYAYARISTRKSSMRGSGCERCVYKQITNRAATVKPLNDGTAMYTPPLLDMHTRSVPASEDVKSNVKLIVPSVPARGDQCWGSMDAISYRTKTPAMQPKIQTLISPAVLAEERPTALPPVRSLEGEEPPHATAEALNANRATPRTSPLPMSWKDKSSKAFALP